MGVKFNNKGFVQMTPDSTLEHDSLRSAFSGKRVVPTGVLEKVPGTDGLFYRITHGESVKLSKAQRKAIQDKAKAWQADLQAAEAEPKPEAPGDPDGKPGTAGKTPAGRKNKADDSPADNADGQA